MAATILLAIDIADEGGLGRHMLDESLRLLDVGGTLHVVSVVPEFGLPMVASYFQPGYEKEALKAVGQALNDWVARNVPQAVNVRPHVLHGTIYDEILRAANSIGADLIVMGAQRPDLRDYLLGPNVARVVRHARQSVYVVREAG